MKTNDVPANGAAGGKGAGPGPEDFASLPDGLQRTLMGLAANSMMSRAEMLRLAGEGARDLDEDCGYPKGPVPSAFYQDLFDREPVPARVVEVYPNECWQVSPSVYEDEEADKVTDFEAAWDDLGQSLRAEQSWHSGEAGSVVWEYLHRLDVLSGVGRYALLFLGLDDGLPLDQPAAGSGAAPGLAGPQTTPAPAASAGAPHTDPHAAEGGVNGPPALAPTPARKGAARKLLFVRVFPETLARVAAVEQDPSSPRFGHPLKYDITFADATAGGAAATPGAAPGGSDFSTHSVHWTRVIHVTDNRRENEVYGVPRMQQVLPRLLDLRKLYGGSAEMYWKGAFPGIALETWPQLGWDVEIDEEKTRAMMWRYQNSLQRYLQLTGQSAKPLSPQVVDPSGQIDKQIEAICIKIACPIRIFKGSERGELASLQDDVAWNDRLKQRQAGHITPRIIVPFVDRLVGLGVLPQPGQYFVWWPDLTSRSDEERAAVAAQRTTAIVAYSGAPNGPATIAPMDYWTRVHGYTDEEAQSIVDNAEAEKERIQKEQEAAQAKAAKLAQEQAQADHQRQLELSAAQGPPAAPPPAPGSPPTPPSPGPPRPKGPPRPGAQLPPGAVRPAGAGPAANWDPSQPRDQKGEWTAGGAAAPAPAAKLQVVGQNVIPAHRRRVQTAVDSLPRGMHDLLARHGVKIEAVGRIENPSGVIGVDYYGDYKKDVVRVAERFGAAANEVTSEILRHEVGHAIDEKLSAGGRTLSLEHAGLKKAYAEDVAAMPKSLSKKLADFVRPGDIGPTELFAQSVATHTGETLTVKGKDFARGFPKSHAVVRKILDDHGLLGSPPAANWDPGQARDAVGRFASGAAGASAHRGDVLRSVGTAAGGLAYKGLRSAAGKGIDLAKVAGGKAAHLEHLAKAAAADRISRSVAKLPGYLKSPLMAAFYVGRAGTRAAFASWTAGQAMAERVAKERGATPEQARRLRGVLSGIDITAFKPLSLALHYSGLHATGLTVVSMIPPASAGYLAYSTAKNPLATLRAARGVIRDTISRLAKRKGTAVPQPSNNQDLLANTSAARANAGLVADALAAHDYDDWYVALLSAAIDETQDVGRAIEVANAAHEEISADPGSAPDPADLFGALGVTKEQALAALGVGPGASAEG